MRHVQFPLWPLAAAAVLLLPGRVAAQEPEKAPQQTTMVVCKDGSQAKWSANQACSKHGGVDSAATMAATQARGAGGQPQPELVICTDGSSALAGTTACRSHGGVDSSATRATINRRFHGQSAEGKPPSADSTESDSVHIRPPGPGAARGDTVRGRDST